MADSLAGHAINGRIRYYFLVFQNLLVFEFNQVIGGQHGVYQ